MATLTSHWVGLNVIVLTTGWPAPTKREPAPRPALRIGFLCFALAAGIVVLHTPPTWELPLIRTILARLAAEAGAGGARAFRLDLASQQAGELILRGWPAQA